MEQREVSVLHLIGSLVGGGAERQLGLLAAAMVRAGLGVHVGYLHGGVNLKPLAETGVALYQLQSAGNYDPLVVLRLCRLIRRVRPDVVQTWLSNMDVMGGVAATLMRVPHILSERSSAEMYADDWKNWLRRQVGLRATAVVANSAAGCKFWRETGRQGICHVIRNGLPLAEIEQSPAADLRELGLATGMRLIIFAGRFSPEKNALTILEAVLSVIAGQPDVAVAFFGEGPLEIEMRLRADRSAAPERIKFPGYAGDLWRWLRAASVAVCASVVEGNPNVVMEAMAIGTPLIVSEIPAHRELLDEDTAVFCSPKDPVQLAAVIRRVLADPEAASARATAARRRAASWSLDVALRNYSDVYHEIIRACG